MFDYLDAPVTRIGAAFAPVAHSPVLLDALTPGPAEVEQAVRAALRPRGDG